MTQGLRVPDERAAAVSESKFHRLHQLPRAAAPVRDSATSSRLDAQPLARQPPPASVSNDMDEKWGKEPEPQCAERFASSVVLRQCEDGRVRTAGFQKIEEAAHLIDRRRARRPPSTGDLLGQANGVE